MIRSGDSIDMDALNRHGRDYDGIIRKWKENTRELNVDIIDVASRNGKNSTLRMLNLRSNKTLMP